MTDFKWYKREPGAFFEATRGWDGETKAFYGLLLDLIYMHDGRVADDAAYIVGQLGLSSKRKWTALKNTLIARGKITVTDGYIENFRATFETKKRRKNRDKSEITESLSNENSDLALTDIEREKEGEKDTNLNHQIVVSQSEERTDDDDSGFEEFWDAFPHAEPSSQPKALKAWLALSPDDRQAALQVAQMPDANPRGVFAWSWLAEGHFRFGRDGPAQPIHIFQPTEEERAARLAQLERAYQEQIANDRKTA